MKKLIMLLGLTMVFRVSAAGVEKVLLRDYVEVPYMDFAYEIKTNSYDKVVLDCQSFVTGINFYNNSKVIHNFYLDAYGECQDVHNFITFSRDNQLPVCLEIDSSNKELRVSNDSDGCQ